MEDNVTGTFLVRLNEKFLANCELLIRDGDTVRCYLVRKEYATTVDDLEHYAKREGAYGAPLFIHLTTPCLMGIPYDDWETEYSLIKLKSKIRDGKFSEVWEGTWNDIMPVVIKTPKPDSLTVSSFLTKAKIMKKLQHKKLIKLYAVCTREHPLYIVTELMTHGNLLDYLTKGPGQHLKLPELLDVGKQVASGMEYIKSQHYVHRDLMARNILVEKRNTVKIGGFDLTRLLVDGKYLARHKDEFPIRWTAPEALELNEFSSQSDVWSFGVFITELVTHGCNPYLGMTEDEVMVQVKKGYHMPQPAECPESLYQIMLQCWKTKPEERVTFEFLKHYLENYLH